MATPAPTRKPEPPKQIVLMPGANGKYNHGCESVFYRQRIHFDLGYNRRKKDGVSHL